MSLARPIPGAVVAALLILLIPARAAEHGSPPRFIVRGLGTFPGGYQTVGSSVNNSGQITGSGSISDAADPGAEGPYHPFLYQSGRLRDLGLLPGYVNGMQGRINDRGQVVGYQTLQHFGAPVPVLYEKGRIVNLTEVLGNSAYPAFMNNRGAIVGSSYPPGSKVLAAFIYNDGVLIHLGPLVPGEESVALDINDSGDATGYATAESGNPGAYHAVRFSDGQIVDLGVLPGSNTSTGDRINRAGHVMGNSGGRGFLHRGGAMINIGKLRGDTHSIALALNNRDHIVGISMHIKENGGEGILIQHAMLWIEGRMWDLNTLIPAGSGWKLEAALGINDRGQIIAVSDRKVEGMTRTCLLTPLIFPR